MASFNLITVIGVSITLLTVFPQFAFADEASFCHDMPARQKVLDEGNEQLRYGGRGGLRRGPGEPVLAPSSLGAYSPGRYIEEVAPPKDTAVQLEQMLIDTVSRMRRALAKAHTLEDFDKTSLANVLYTRLLKEIESKPAPDDITADILEGAAGNTIMLHCHLDPAETPHYQKHYYSSSDFDYDVGSNFSAAEWRGKYSPVFEVKQAVMSEQDWQVVESLYTRALLLRRKFKDNSYSLRSDLRTLGALSERKQRPSDALIYYMEAMHMQGMRTGTDDGTAPILSNLLSRSPDISKEVESKLYAALPNDKTGMVLSALIEFYVEKGRGGDAVKLFEQYNLFRKSDRLPLTGDAVVAVLDAVPASDLAALTTYIAETWSHSPEVGAKFTNMMAKMTGRGWTVQVNAICDSMAAESAVRRANRINGLHEFDRVDRLLAIASWCRQSNDQKRLLSISQKILEEIKGRHDSEEQSLNYLTQLNEVLAQVPNQQTSLAAVTAESQRLAAFHKDQIRRRQCLDMAARLNKTAFELERSDQVDMAHKLYQQAVEIKQINLASNDPETASQIVDLARTAAKEKNYSEAQSLFEKALSILRKNSQADPADTISALESYGEMLNDQKQFSQANKIYDEARALYKKSHHQG